jgi:hypothetical protein
LGETISAPSKSADKQERFFIRPWRLSRHIQYADLNGDAGCGCGPVD